MGVILHGRGTPYHLFPLPPVRDPILLHRGHGRRGGSGNRGVCGRGHKHWGVVGVLRQTRTPRLRVLAEGVTGAALGRAPVVLGLSALRQGPPRRLLPLRVRPPSPAHREGRGSVRSDNPRPPS